mmetsp:Transcript_27053/g.71280  ORF Transcript_27053/g.71280 Transcript_27053/m.71280 type:complete len:293 (+) Transcript_27053:649-1527(+)
MKIALKESLKSLPGFGWAMQCFLFVFLARDKNKDLKYLEDLVAHHHQRGLPVSLVIFPEGTDLHPEAVVKCEEFAKQRGLVQYKYILHPKVVGFQHSMGLLRGSCGALYDVTIAYVDHVDGERPTELSLLSFRLPREVHMHVRRDPMTSLPTDDAGLEKLVVERFAAKEAALRAFYETPYPAKGVPPDAPGRGRRFPQDERQPPVSPTERYLSWAAGVAFWSLASLLACVVLNTPFGWFAAIGNAVFWVIMTRSGGADRLELRVVGGGGKPLLEGPAAAADAVTGSEGRKER